MNMNSDRTWRSHPLRWKDLLETVQNSGMENPDVYIEDLRRYGPARKNGKPIDAENMYLDGEDVDYIHASFSVIRSPRQNLIIIRHHY